MQRLLAYISLLISIKAFGYDLHIAVASNFIRPMEQLKKDFEKLHNRKLAITYASSGKIYSQIANGAPYAVFLSADESYPKKLIDLGKAKAESYHVYATGSLSLWSPEKQDKIAWQKFLEQPRLRIALANPLLAPYGKAAKQVLDQLSIADAKIITADNVSSAFHYAQGKNVQAAFVSSSFIPSHGTLWSIPRSLYDPVKQGAVLLKEQELAKKFLSFLQSSESKKVMGAYGYLHE